MNPCKKKLARGNTIAEAKTAIAILCA